MRVSRLAGRAPAALANTAFAGVAIAKGFALAVAALALSGCGLGGLIAGAVLGIDAATGGGGPADNVATRVTFASALERNELRRRGDADVVPICYTMSGREPSRVEVEFLSADNPGDRWRSATLLPSGGSTCPAGAESLLWNAAADLDLDGRSAGVRLRIFPQGNTAAGDESEREVSVGNTPPLVELLPSSDEEGMITIVFSARDEEDDPLERVSFSYRIPGEPREVEMRLVSLPDPVPAERSGNLYFPVWDSTVARDADGRRNVQGLEILLRAQDAFGEDVETSVALDLFNNHPPEARVVGLPGELDSSHEIPLRFELVDDDGDPVDVVVQYAVGTVFPDLPPDLERLEFRRTLLRGEPNEELPSFETIAETRRASSIATPSSRRPDASDTVGLAAGKGPRAASHVFLWDSARDLPPFSATSAILRIVPYDLDEQGEGAESPSAIHVDNRLFSSPVALGRNQQEPPGGDACGLRSDTVSGIALGDIDGDGRIDLVATLPEARSGTGGSNSGGALAERRGRVDVFLREPHGSLPERPAYSLVPGPSGAGDPDPRDPCLADLDGDGRLDLVVLDAHCDRCAPCAERGDVSVFYSSPDGDGTPTLPPTPDLILPLGIDVRSLGVGDVDGDGAADLVVANHDRSDTGEPRSIGVLFSVPGGFSTMLAYPLGDGPEEVIVADLLPDPGPSSDEIAYLIGGLDGIRILDWDSSSGEIFLATQIPARQPSAIARLDSGDGRYALAVASALDRTIRVLGGLEDGKPESSGSFVLAHPAQEIIAFDVDGDGDPEIAVLEPGGDLVELALRERTDDWRVFDRLPIDLPGESSRVPSRAAFADIDDDGREDLLVGSTSGIRFYRASAAGSLDPELTRGFELASSFELQDVVLGNLDRNQRTDLALAFVNAREASYCVGCFLQDRVGDFPARPDLVLCATEDPRVFQPSMFLDIADTDQNGGADVIAASRREGVDLYFRHEAADGAPAWGIAAGNARAFARPDATIASNATSAMAVRLGRFGGPDGIDVLLLDEFGSRLELINLRPAGDAGFAPGERSVITLEALPVAFDAGDLDGDGALDLAVLHLSGEVRLLLQREDGSPRFVEADCATPDCAPLGEGTGEVTIRDLDGDGAAELLVSSLASRSLSIFQRSDPSGPFRETRLEPRAVPFSVAVGDLTGNGLLDVALSSREAEGVVLYHQRRGENRFSRFPSWIVRDVNGPSNPAWVDIGDVSGDGRPEMVVVRPSRQSIEIMGTR